MKQYAIISLFVFILLSCNRDKVKENSTEGDEYYTCSMDPQVVEYKPGICPICKMALTKVAKRHGEGKDEIELSDQQIQLGNIQTEVVTLRPLSEQNLITAVLKANEKLINSISVKAMGRIDKLYYKNSGDFVKKGTLVFELYSEELNVLKQEYQLAMKNKKGTASGTINYSELAKSAGEKLSLYGLTPQQITDLEINPPSDLTPFFSPFSGYITEVAVTEGQNVMLGQSIIKLADYTSLWAEAQLFNIQVGKIRIGDKVQVSFPDMALNSSPTEIEFIDPVSFSGRRFTQFRVQVENANNLLKPGMIAYIDLLKSGAQVTSMTSSGIIRNANGSRVWLRIAKNKFKFKSVQTGTEANGFTEIKLGLKKNDVVVVQGSYLINSEFIFKKASTITP